MKIRPLEVGDLSELVQLCREHAEFERSEFRSDGLEVRLRATLLGSRARASCLVAAAGDGSARLVGFAVMSREYSTWNGGDYLHMDCLYLRPEARGAGLGRRFMAAIAARAVADGLPNLQWQTPTWNEAAIRFYDRLGAVAARKTRFTLSHDACCGLMGVRESKAGRFRTRSTRSVDAWTLGGWLLKRYEITVPDATVEPEVWAAAERVVRQEVRQQVDQQADPQGGDAPEGQGLGFVTVHRGEHRVWLLVDTWHVDTLHHRIFAADLDRPTEFERVPPDGPAACVWELDVVAHERDAFVRHILDPVELDVAGYLGDTLWREGSRGREGRL